MRIKWTEAQAVGIEEIDNQHKMLFNSINDLVDAMSEGRGTEETDKLFVFLENYILDHFKREEEYMEKYHYPDPEKDAHLAAHKDFKESFAELKDKLSAKGPARSLTMKVSSLLGSWWLSHINNIDKALGAYLKPHINK